MATLGVFGAWPMPMIGEPHQSAEETLLVGFDSAWTAHKKGALVGLVRRVDGTYRELGPPVCAGFSDAATTITKWQSQERVEKTLILIDQPTIVRNAKGQRPVENLFASPVSRRYGGMQPANISRIEMFGSNAPIWSFMDQFGGATQKITSGAKVRIYETYPVGAMIALGWLLPDVRPTGRLPKYNPERRKTFSMEDWRFVCDRLVCEFECRRLNTQSSWLTAVRNTTKPRKADQDQVDSILCLFVAMLLAEKHDCLIVGEPDTGYLVVPYGETLYPELKARCNATGRDASSWVRIHGKTVR